MRVYDVYPESLPQMSFHHGGLSGPERIKISSLHVCQTFLMFRSVEAGVPLGQVSVMAQFALKWSHQVVSWPGEPKPSVLARTSQGQQLVPIIIYHLPHSEFLVWEPITASAPCPSTIREGTSKKRKVGANHSGTRAH
jgi:hypothetical protein